MISNVVLTWIFNVVLTWEFVVVWCAVIIALAVGVGIHLARNTDRLRKDLLKLAKELSDIGGSAGFVSEFEQYNVIAKDIFGLAWTEFVETLVLPAPGSGKPIRNTSEVSRYLNEATIVFSRIDFHLYHLMPNLLTGLGILGTFIGLAVGVGAASAGLTSGDPGEITSSLQRLLDGASLAFLTSIAGIACSIGFARVEHKFSRRLHLALDNWVGAIEHCLERVTREEVGLQNLEQTRRAARQLEQFNTQLIFSIEKALDEKIAGRLSPQLDRLVNAVDRLREDRSVDASRLIEQGLDRFTNTMQKQTRTQFGEMATIVAELNRTLRYSAAELEQSRRDTLEALDSVLTTTRRSMDASTSAMTDTLQDVLSNVSSVISDASQEMAKQMTASSTAASAELFETVSSATQNLAETGIEAAATISGSLHGLRASTESLNRSARQSEHILTSMTAFVDRLDGLRASVESAQQQIAAIAEPVGRAASVIGTSTLRTADTLEQTRDLVDRVDGLVRTLERHQRSVADTWHSYQERFEGIDASLVKVFNQLDEGLARYCKQVKLFAVELDKTTSTTIEHLASATSELKQAIEELGDTDLSGVISTLGESIHDLMRYRESLGR